MKKLLLITAFCAASSAASAAITFFNLQGTGGIGLLPTNENPPATGGTPGTGGEVGAGIFFDDFDNSLTIDIAWGSGNGFTDLSGNVTGIHIHGPTTSSGAAAFTENAGVAINLGALPGFDNSGTSGGFSGTVTLSAAQATQIFDNRLYINVHTTANPAGEIRGNLVPVPEPSTYAAIVGALVLGVVMLRRRR